MNDVDGYQGYTLNLKQSVPVPLMETVKVLNKEPKRREILQLNTSGKVNFSHVSEFVRDIKYIIESFPTDTNNEEISDLFYCNALQ